MRWALSHGAPRATFPTAGSGSGINRRPPDSGVAHRVGYVGPSAAPRRAGHPGTPRTTSAAKLPNIAGGSLPQYTPPLTPPCRRQPSPLLLLNSDSSVRLGYIPIYRHIASCGRQCHDHPIRRLLTKHLATEAAVLPQPKRQVQHVQLVIARLGEARKSLVVHVHVAGGAREAALARALQINVVAVSDRQD